MQLPKVLLADDHTLINAAFEMLLKPHCEIVGTVTDGRALVDIVPRVNPDVVIVDIAMPLLNGLDAARQLKRITPRVKLIFVTMNEDPDLALAAMDAGASGYILKKSLPSELLLAIQTALKNGTYVTPDIARRIEQAFIWNSQQAQGRQLSERQREVVQLLAEGKSMKEAAAVLDVTPRTIAFHKYKIMQDFHISTSAELVQFAIKNRIIIPNPKL